MHELSIARNILELVDATCHEQGYSGVETVRVNVGKASGIMTDALVFAFNCAKDETLSVNATLEIHEIPVGGRCRECNSDFISQETIVLNCPRCGGAAFEITTGHELEIFELEVDG
ncbi:MAG: hydrogenase maturation nickel metallochaperone HypA [Deltaproteobacteria bacterium]|nr:hydrogenase maturation nickel metallochaperone HypA [Deltaproteobacteria bacterium]